MKSNICENASERISYVGRVFKMGERQVKNDLLKCMVPEWAYLHKDGYIHIHDLDAYGLTYNCLTFDILTNFPYNEFKCYSQSRKIIAVFDYFKDTIAKIGNEQSGGMSFGNFDIDLAIILKNLDIEFNENNKDLVRSSISSLIHWCNNSHERMGQVSYYVTLNIGLANDGESREICAMVIDEFNNSPWYVYKPNIVFKVKDGINEDLLNKALLCTARKMIPTYLLCDSITNKTYDPYEIAIMGCRTRVVQNEYGKSTSIGRGNIAYVSINLPRIALETVNEYKTMQPDEVESQFEKKWSNIASVVKDILIDRYTKLISLDKEDFPNNLARNLWINDFSKADKLEQIFKNGTLSIGFIGLSEAIEILNGKKFHKNDKDYETAINIVKFMREFIDNLRSKYKLNFTLLGTSGEYISGRFPEIDLHYHEHKLLDKKFYTNSFHIEVDSGISAFEKIEKEAPFHQLCNGGCITYVELKEAPFGNNEGLLELVRCAEKSGANYLGFNFNKDVCKNCGEEGIFDKCEYCGSMDIVRIRRVSGYLEILDYFTTGKKNEEKNRKRN